MKIIHIVENLDKGAVESLLVNIFLECRKLRPDWKWTFFCILGKPGRLDDKVRNAGAEIIYSPVTISDKIAFLNNLRKVLRANKYDIIHSHHDYLSGFYLLASTGIRFKKRLLHVHNTDRSIPVGSGLLRKVLMKPFRKLAIHYSDVVVGVSNHALQEFVHSKDRSNKFTVLYHGMNFDRFDINVNRESLKTSLGIPADGKICLFVGRMNDLKNPMFVVEVMKYLLSIRKDVYAVFVGEGYMTERVRTDAAKYGIADHIRILGWHEDVPALMKSSDVFIFPRLEHPKEAFGVVIVEAQAAGLPMFITEGIVHDAIVVPELAHINSLQDSKEWARQINEVLNKPHSISQEESLARMKNSVFELTVAARNLIDLYETLTET